MLLNVLREISFQLNEAIISYKAVSGGSINEAYKLETETDHYFLKYNTGSERKGIITSELDGLEQLTKAGVRTPKIVHIFHLDSLNGIVLEWIENDSQNRTSASLDFAEQLLTIHSSTSENFGYGQSNYIGSLKQTNALYSTFEEYYVVSRLEPQLKKAYDHGYFNSHNIAHHFSNIISSHIPLESPTLIHGDLWSGNYIMSTNDKCYLIDPSISYSHREMDIAIMHLFGSVPMIVMDRYHSQLPLNDGWKERMDIFQLYYLLVHLNLFGKSYYNSVKRIIEKYT